ncbi:MAG: glycoside hydrolase family 15 protein [Microbacteriaceae bacterium]
MALGIEDYALIGNSHTAALVGRDGSIDWLCLPRFDSASTFGALLGSKDHGRWLVAPTDTDAKASRHYEKNTFVLITRWTTDSGEVEVVDFMPSGHDRVDVIRRIRGIRGSVELHQELRIRFDYAAAMPWVRKVTEKDSKALIAVAGADAVIVRGPELHATDHSHQNSFTVAEGESVDLSIGWFSSYRDAPAAIDVEAALASTKKWWNDWARNCSHDGPYTDEVIRSLLVLRALTHDGTGGIVAAATTSLPEDFGGERNWDYRYVWLRDASLTLDVLLNHGFRTEVEKWRRWLLRAIAGDPADVQIMYGLAGERYLSERELSSLPGYRGSAPVRVGNAAALQFQADVIGEVMVALHSAREAGIAETRFSWSLQRSLMTYLEKNWQTPDQGIWEIRGEAHAFTHSRVMVWSAFDRAVKGATEFGLPGPVQRWSRLRDRIRDEIEEKGFDHKRGTYTQYFGSAEVDASLLQLPQVGYCAADDPRMLGTVAAIEHDLLRDGLVLRYRTEKGVDGLSGSEHPFLACSFWLVAQYAQSNRMPEATKLMDRLVTFCNDVGLLSEEYDVDDHRQAGNTPQAFSHLALVRAADAMTGGRRHVSH